MFRTIRNAFLLCFFAALLLILQGCVAGVQSLGTIKILDGPVIEYVQVGSKGQDGPKLVVIESFSIVDGKITKVSEYSASGNSLTGQILGGTAAAAMQAGGAAGAAYLRRPNKTRVTTSVTSSGSTSTSGSTSESSSSSTATSGNGGGNDGGNDGGHGGGHENGHNNNGNGQGHE